MQSSMSPGRQRGAALIVGLILLMVLTVLAVSSMRTAGLELLMAGNAQFRESAFQLAQTGVDATLRAPPAAPSTDCAAAPWDAPVDVAAMGGRYTRRVCDRGLSLCAGSSGECFNYEVTAEGTTEQRGARARIVQGYRIQAATGN